MPDIPVAVYLAVLSVLAGYLHIKQRQRAHTRTERYDPAEWTGKGFDAANLRTRVDEMQRNYLAVQQAPRHQCFHRALLSWARQTVARLDYFRQREPHDHSSVHGP